MDKRKKIAVIEGDKRQEYLFELLKKEGYNADYINKNEEAAGDLIVFPMPPDENIKFSHIKQSTVIFGGITKNAKAFFDKEDIEYYCFSDSEVFTLENAYYTAQGAIRLLLENTEEYLSKKEALITGYGRIAKALAEKLKALGLKITILARNEVQLISAENSGYDVLSFNEYKNNLNSFDYVFNTIPFNVFMNDDIKMLNNEAIYFELASAPYGADKRHFNDLKKKYISASGLPGKLLPLSSGKLIFNYIIKQIQEGDLYR